MKQPHEFQDDIYALQRIRGYLANVIKDLSNAEQSIDNKARAQAAKESTKKKNKNYRCFKCDTKVFSNEKAPYQSTNTGSPAYSFTCRGCEVYWVVPADDSALC